MRDQGRRPTCLAFVASSAHEHVHGMTKPLCTEWLYYHSVMRAGDPPDAGSTLTHTAAVLAEDGQPDETGWPYCTTAPSDSWTPPNDPGALYFATGKITKTDVDALCTDLDQGVPTILALKIDRTFDRWDHASGLAVITHDPSPPSPTTGHAVLAVGHGILKGDRHILIRNSWGHIWGDNGHAWISEKYISARSYGTLQLKEI